MLACTGLYIAGMGDDVPVSEQAAGRDDALALPEHLSALVGACMARLTLAVTTTST